MMSPEFRVSASGPSALGHGSVPVPLCPLQSSTRQLRLRALCDPPPRPGEAAGLGPDGPCRQQAGAAARLTSLGSQLPEVTDGPPSPEAQFLHSLCFITFGCV